MIRQLRPAAGRTGSQPERALAQGQQIADTDRQAAESAMAAFQATDDVTPQIAGLLTFDYYPVDQVNQVAIQQEANEMLEFGLLKQKFDVSQLIG